MKRKPINVDWAELENAFNNSNEELIYYLDLVTGQVILEGEGEEEEFEDEEQLYEHGGAPPPDGPRPDSTRLYVAALDDELKLEWMRSFLDESEGLEPRFVAAVETAFDSDSAEAVQDVLRAFPESRGRWFLYRSERLREIIDDWLAENSVETTVPPPWRG